MKILVYVPDGTGIRNYLYSNVFESRNAELALVHKFDSRVSQLVLENTALERAISLPSFGESLKEKFFREQAHIARINHNTQLVENPTIKRFYNKPKTGFKKKLFYRVTEFMASLVNCYEGIEKIEKHYEKAIRSNPFYSQVKEMLKQERPDVIFLTHQRAVEAAYVFAAAQDLGIKTVTVIYSWDNLPKARLALRASKYLVWSQYMKEELLHYYPEIEQTTVQVTGTPQFEFYKNKDNVLDRNAFAKAYHLDSSKKWLCFSGDDALTSPHDPQYLNDLANGIKSSAYSETIQILFRRCPVDYSDRYDWVLENHKDIIVPVAPQWLEAGEWTSIFPKRSDIQLLINTAYHCDAVFNIGSTMAFDFLQFEKPCVYINYDVPNNGDWSVDTIYKFQHFRTMPSKEAVLWLNTKNEIPALLQKIVQNDYTINTTKDWFNTVVNHPTDASDSIFKAIIN